VRFDRYGDSQEEWRAHWGRVGRFGHPELQHDRLVEDGVSFLADGRVDLARHLWEPDAPAELFDR
jgi:hypothetical protein